MVGTDDGEVRVVERRDFSLLGSLRERRETCICPAERKAVVAGDEVGPAFSEYVRESEHNRLYAFE